MDSIYAKTRVVRDIICSLKIEPFIFLFCLSTALSDIATLQMVQGKIFLNNPNQTADYCIAISALKTSGSGNSDGNNTKNEVLADLAQFNIYLALIGALPSFFYVLFIGSWTDNYIHGRKISLLLGTLGYVGQFSLLLLNAMMFEIGI